MVEPISTSTRSKPYDRPVQTNMILMPTYEKPESKIMVTKSVDDTGTEVN